MTPTATYLAEENCLQELPTMEKPVEPHRYHYDLISLGGLLYDSNVKNYRLRLDEYNAHLATLRKIPCDISCKGLWKDGQEVVENVDYVLKEVPCPYFEDVNDPVEYTTTAFPLVPAGEDERTGIYSVQRLTNGSGHSNLTIITEEATPDVHIGSLLLVPFVHGCKDPKKVKVLLDENGKPVATKLRTCIVVEYIFP